MTTRKTSAPPLSRPAAERRGRRRFIGALSALAATHTGVQAQESDYPSRPITLIVPWPPGGASDLALRAFAQAASRQLKQNFIIENKPGAGGTLGPSTMARTAKPDGYTLSQHPAGLYRLSAMKKMAWDPVKDFTFISRVAGYLVAFVVRTDSPFRSMRDVIAWARANPGKLSYGSSGIGTTNHLGPAAVGLKAGVEFNHVPFKGSVESLAALMGGHVMMVSSESAAPLVETGRARLLATCGEQRYARFPDVPTLVEQGLDVVASSPWGIVGPAGMDPRIVAMLDAAFRRAMDDPELIRALAQYDQAPMYQSTPDYRVYAQREQVDSRRLIESLDLVEK